MILGMNDFDFEEQRLLNALGDNTQYKQQQYNFNFDDSIINNNNHRSNDRSHSRNNYQNNNNEYNIPEPTKIYEPYDLEPRPISGNVSIGSLSPEEFLENFELNDDSSNASTNTMVTDASNDDNSSESNTVTNLTRKITLGEKEDSKPDIVASKSSPSVVSNDEEVPYRAKSPTEADILCGQSRVCANHPGNQFFQSVLDEFAYRYDLATSKQEKMCMTKEIVSRVHTRGGHFLKQKKDGMWEEISTVAARDKVSHALRTKVAGWKRNKKQEQRGSITPPPGRRSSMSRGSIRSYRRRSSSDIVPIPLDGNEATAEQVLSGLMKSQKEIFATMNSLMRGNTGGNNNYQQPSNHRHSFSTYQGNNHYRMER